MSSERLHSSPEHLCAADQRPGYKVSHGRSAHKCPDVGEMSRDCRGHGHGWTHQMGAPSSALTALEISIGCRRATLTNAEYVFIHAQAHRTTRIAPLEAGVGKDSIQSFALRSSLHLL